MFCVRCGASLPNAAAFCPACGTPVLGQKSDISSVKSPPSVDFHPHPMPVPVTGRLENAFLWSAIIACVGGFFLLFRGDPLDFIINEVWATAIYALGYRNLREGRIRPAKTLALVSAVAAGIGTIVGLQFGYLVGIVFGVPICVMLSYAYLKL